MKAPTHRKTKPKSDEHVEPLYGKSPAAVILGDLAPNALFSEEHSKAIPISELRDKLQPAPQTALSPVSQPLYDAVILNSALYNVGVFVAGLYLAHIQAVIGALVTVAICYLTALVQISFPQYRTAATVLVAASIISGILAGLGLI